MYEMSPLWFFLAHEIATNRAVRFKTLRLMKSNCLVGKYSERKAESLLLAQIQIQSPDSMNSE